MGMKLYSVQLQEKYGEAISSTSNDSQDNEVPLAAHDNSDNQQEVCMEVIMQLAFIGLMLDERFHEEGEIIELTDYGKHFQDVLFDARDRRLGTDNAQVKRAVDVFKCERHLAYRFGRVPVATSESTATPAQSHRD